MPHSPLFLRSLPFSVLIFVLILSACAPISPSLQAQQQTQPVLFQGTILFHSAPTPFDGAWTGGEYYTILSESGSVYYPRDLPPPYRLGGLNVEIQGETVGPGWSGNSHRLQIEKISAL